MSKAILSKIRRELAWHHAMVSKATQYWRNESNKKDLRRCAARLALRSRHIIEQLEHYQHQFSRPTLPLPPFTYEVELGDGQQYKKRADEVLLSRSHKNRLSHTVSKTMKVVARNIQELKP